MSDLVVALIPYGLAAAAAEPAAAVVAVLILGKAKRPIFGGIVFVVGALALDVLFSVVVLSVMEASGKFTSGADIGACVDVVLGVLFLALGVSAVFQKENRTRKLHDGRGMDRLAASGPAKLLLVGVSVQIVNSDVLAIMAGGLKEVAVSNVSATGEFVAVVWLLALVLLPYYVPVVMYVVVRQRAAVLLRSFSDWLFAHSRPVEIVTGFVFFGLFFWKGLAELT